ncbi:MAG: YheV family putative metal-binding protein, partial [Alcanivorax sp.]
MKRQFIAGATCPECGQMDKIQRVLDGDKQWMECVACGATKDLD